MAKKPVISIIIVHYKVEEALYACLQSLYESKSKHAFEILVVDNDEHPFIEKSLQEKFPDVRYFGNANTGFGAGNNIGAYHAKGKYLFFLNPDSLVMEDAVDTLADFLEKQQDVGIVAPLLLNSEKEVYPLQGARELTPIRAIFSLSFIQKIFPKNGIANSYWIKTWNKKDPQEVDVVPGSAFMIKKELFEKVGGFDENYFLYFEEHDLCNRIKKVGEKVIMLPKAKVIHTWGESTKKSDKNIEGIFQKSRLYYFKKFYGAPKAYATEAILTMSKETVVIGLILLIAAVLRFYSLDKLMMFIGDFGWFYLSAKDMMQEGVVPFVGIASSHPWIYQGPLWTYLLSIALLLGNFNPLAGGYLAATIGIITVFLFYFLVKEMLGKRIAFFSTLFLATSPLVVVHARMPYHTSPIPLFVLLYLYCIYKWLHEEKSYIPFIFFFFSVLYNFELATAVLASIPILFFIYGFFTKKPWVKQQFSKKIIVFSLLGFIIPLIPMILFDISHYFGQTLQFVAWLGYRVLVLVGYPPLNPEIKNTSYAEMATFLYTYQQRFFYIQNGIMSLIVLCAGLIGAVMNYKKTVYALIFLSFIIPLVALFLTKTPSEAYLPMLFVQGAMLVGILADMLYGKTSLQNVLTTLLFTFLCLVNTLTLFQRNFLMGQHELYGYAYVEKVAAAKKIIEKSGGMQYSLSGVGPGSQFPSHTMHYEYLTWWLGAPPISRKEGDIVVSEGEDGISINKK